MAKELRMDGYYIHFAKTGVPEIDRILSAVACAGKAVHHTQYWNEEYWGDGEGDCYDGHRGRTCVEMIQNAADDAAKALAPEPTHEQ